jgi:hypothetical protein
MNTRRWLFTGVLLMAISTSGAAAEPAGYETLVRLFADWRSFERPPLADGAPDYTAGRMAAAHRELGSWRARLAAIDTRDWPVDRQVDWHLLRAEMNGFDFNCRVLQPWARDPAFYLSVWPEQSDVPAHEGPTHHALVELWTYRYPLSAADAAKLAGELETIPPLLAQARRNLTGNARELWSAGIHTVAAQRDSLAALRARLGTDITPRLDAAIRTADEATAAFITWLEAEAPSKTGPSGIGRENYDWYQRNVRYVPLDWEGEVRLLERELHRAWSSLALEESRNRELPELQPAATPEAFAALTDRGATRLMRFLAERRIMPVVPNMEPALREHLGTFVPANERNFFEIGRHLDPLPLYSHFYHWFDLARMRDTPHPSPLRRGALLYNIFDSYSEGAATGVEEMFMHAGLYEDSPRSREIVWIMLAQRAARGLGSLYAHANRMTMEEAGRVHVEWTPRGWMTVEPKLLQFEQHLYLRQPGYGTSYVTGKYLMEQLLAERGQQQAARGKPYSLYDFFSEFQAAGAIPTSLVRWQLTGNDVEIREMVKDGV